MHLITAAIVLTPSLHLKRCAASSTSNPILFTLSSTGLLHVCFGLPRFRYPFTSNINALFKTLSSSLLSTCPYHLTEYVLVILLTSDVNSSASELNTYKLENPVSSLLNTGKFAVQFAGS